MKSVGGGRWRRSGGLKPDLLPELPRCPQVVHLADLGVSANVRFCAKTGPSLKVCFWTHSRLSRPALLTSARTVGPARSGPLADLDDGGLRRRSVRTGATNRCSQCALGLSLIRCSAVAAGPIHQVT